MTIYRGAVKMNISDEDNENKHTSSSSDELNSSDEMVNALNAACSINKSRNPANEQVMYEQIVDCRLKEQRNLVTSGSTRPRTESKELRAKETRRLTADEKTRKMVQQAKAKMFQVSGNPLFHSVLVDKEYAIIGAHVDKNLRCKIIAHKY